MVASTIYIHLDDDKEEIGIIVSVFPGFYTVDIQVDDKLIVKTFLHSLQELTNFKNNILWAVESAIKKVDK